MALARVLACEAQLSIQQVLAEFAGIMQANSAAIHLQAADANSVYTVNTSYADAQEVFSRILPILEHTDDPRISLGSAHNLAYTHIDEHTRLAVLFTRNSRRMPFVDEELEVAAHLASVVFRKCLHG
jgi:hypothetical protein